MLIPIEIARAAATQTGDGHSRYAPGCVHFERLSEHKCRAAATNGRVLLVCDWNETDLYHEYKMLVPLKAESGFSALLPSRIIDGLPKTLKEPIEFSELDEEGTSGLAIGYYGKDHKVELTLDEKPGRSFPEYRKVIPEASGETVISFDPRLMARALNAVIGCVFSDDELLDVTLRISGPNKPMTLEAKNDNGRECMVVIMPKEGFVETSILPRGAMT